MAAIGRPLLLLPAEEDALLEYLTGRPDAMLEDMQEWLWDRLDVSVSITTISRTLKRRKWTRKKLKKRASEQCPFLRDAWMGRLTGWRADQLVFLDENAANEHTKDRKYGWSP